jgi:hypothetical protein
MIVSHLSKCHCYCKVYLHIRNDINEFVKSLVIVERIERFCSRTIYYYVHDFIFINLLRVESKLCAEKCEIAFVAYNMLKEEDVNRLPQTSTGKISAGSHQNVLKTDKLKHLVMISQHKCINAAFSL